MRRTKLTYTTATVIMAILAVIVIVASFKVRAQADRNTQTGKSKGAAIFQENGCAQCHYTDQTAHKMGPGLQGLLEAETLPASGRPATRDNVKKQILDPINKMPSYEDRLSDRQLQQILDYLESL